MTVRTRRIQRAGVAAALAAIGLAGCGRGLDSLPAPAAVSGPTYRITAQFDDVGDLTVGAKVKLQGVVIGEVRTIATANFQARVAIDVEKKFPLPVGSTFQIRFTTPLGEDFVSVTAPKAGTTVLADGALVPTARTSEAPSIEDTFTALSLVLNGGGLDKLQTIATELGTALRGRTGAARDALLRLRKVVGDLDAHKASIDRALDGMARLSTALDRGSGVIVQALAVFPQTLQLLAQDTGQIRVLLAKVAKLGDTVTDLLARGQDAMLADFDTLRPTLGALAASRNNLVPTFTSLVRFGRLFDRATPGDYLNLDVTVQLLFDAPPQHPDSAMTAASTSPSAVISTLLTTGLR